MAAPNQVAVPMPQQQRPQMMQNSPAPNVTIMQPPAQPEEHWYQKGCVCCCCYCPVWLVLMIFLIFFIPGTIYGIIDAIKKS